MSKPFTQLSIRLGAVFSIGGALFLLGCTSLSSTPTPTVESSTPPPTEVPTPTAPPTLGQRIDEAESLWNAQEIADYQIEVGVGSAWSSYVYTIAVAGGEVANASAICLYEDAFGSDCPPPDTFDPEEFTVRGLFTRLQSYVGTEAENFIEVRFDDETGYPQKFSYDEPDSIDEEWGWNVKTFEPGSNQ
jgi:hypothetical protein